MKKVIYLTILLCTLLSSVSYGVTLPETISDMDFMKGNYYKSDGNYTFKTINVGEKLVGKVGSVTGYNPPNTDVYQLKVFEDAMISINVVPLSNQYYNNLTIGDLMFIDDISGEKKYYNSSDQKNGISIDDFISYGAYYRSVYLEAGTYYFTVGGKAYSQEIQATNYLSYVDYQIEVTSQKYSAEPSIDTNQMEPYVLKTTADSIYGALRMNLIYSSNSFKSDSNDRILIPAGMKRQIKVKIHNIHSNPLEVFKKEIQYIRNNADKKALERRLITSTYKSDACLNVSVQDNESFKLAPNSFKELTFMAEKDKSYYIDLRANYPTQYKIEYAENDESYPVLKSNEGVKVKPIIMLHTACDIEPAVLDQHNYRIFVNGIDYTNNMGYMGHITNLPESNVGDIYEIRVEVDGYKPYYENITIPAGENGNENVIVFVNVDTTPATSAVDAKPLNEDNIHVYGDPAERLPYYDGELYNDSEGKLVMVGGEFTNNRVVNNRRDGNGVITKDKRDFLNKRIYTSYTVYGDQYAYFAPGGIENVYSGLGVTTHHSYNQTKVVQSGVRLYQVIGLDATSYYKVITTGNYFGMENSQIVMEENGALSEQAQKNILQPQSLQFVFGDNYGGANASLKIHDLTVESYLTLDQLRQMDQRRNNTIQ